MAMSYFMRLKICFMNFCNYIMLDYGIYFVDECLDCMVMVVVEWK